MNTTTSIPNPHLSDVIIADPTIRLIKGRYYLYATDAGASEPGFQVWSSPDLVTWDCHGMALRFDDVTWATAEAWAPDLFVDGDRYLLYFCADSQIGVAEADNPAGPFVDMLGKPLVPHAPDLSSIDPMVFRDDDGRSYLYWGSSPATWLEGKVDTINRCMFVRELGPDLCSFIGDTHTTVCSYPVHIEGSYLFKRQGRYIFMWSAGNWTACDGSNDYHVRAAMAESPFGPFTEIDQPLLESDLEHGLISPGHNSILHLADEDRYLIVYHAHAGDERRHLYLDELSFDEHGRPIPLRPSRSGIRAPKTQLQQAAN
ncbi:MAG: family 43 glycosylhydrolase [Planctomycetota bacterium]|nr:family 43 glycosylhydrolase [Planctomycetota bacterium]